jgi:hypothetical protein
MDEDWKDRILFHLGIAQKQERFDLWDDRRIEGGKDDGVRRLVAATCDINHNVAVEDRIKLNPKSQRKEIHLYGY